MPKNKKESSISLSIQAKCDQGKPGSLDRGTPKQMQKYEYP